MNTAASPTPHALVGWRLLALFYDLWPAAAKTGVARLALLSDPLYRRDVLLVCEAQGAPALTAMAREFREAIDAAESESAGSDSSFSPSRFFNSLFGALGGSEQPAPPSTSKDRQRGGLPWRRK